MSHREKNHQSESVYTVAALQMVSGTQWESNLEAALALMHQAVEAGAKLIVLPENWVVFCSEGYRAFAREAALSEKVMALLQAFARQHAVYVCAGSLPVPSGAKGELRALTRCSLIGPRGQVLGAYDKLHLFAAEVNDAHARYDEGQWFLPGRHPVVVSTPLGVIGLAICYDLRFPELFRWMAQQGAEVFLVPSAFTYVTGQAHWGVLTQARAMENLAYLVAPNQGGAHSNVRQTWGHTCVVDPWGALLAQHPTGSSIVFAEIDRSRVATLRKKMPVLDHTRLTITPPGRMED